MTKTADYCPLGTCPYERHIPELEGHKFKIVCETCRTVFVGDGESIARYRWFESIENDCSVALSEPIEERVA